MLRKVFSIGLLFVLLVSACVPASETSPTVVPSLTSMPLPIATASKTQIAATPTEVAEIIAGFKPEGEGVTLDMEKARWKNTRGQYWSPEVNSWVDLRNADGKDIFLLGGATDFYGSAPTFPLRIYAKTGELTSQGSFAHPAGYDEEFGPASGNWFNFSLPTQLASLLTEVKSYPTPRTELTKSQVEVVLEAFRNNFFELTFKIPSNAKDPSTVANMTCDLGKGLDVIVVNWNDANSAVDHSFYETNNIRWKLQCDKDTHRTTETIAFSTTHKVKDSKFRQGALGPLMQALIRYGELPVPLTEFEVETTSLADGGENHTFGGIPVNNSFIVSVQP